MWLVRVELPWACFGLEVTDDGWIIQAAPSPHGPSASAAARSWPTTRQRVGW